MNLVESIRTYVSSSVLIDGTVVLSEDAETSSTGMKPCLKRLCVTVGMLLLVAGNRVLTIRSTGQYYNIVLTHQEIERVVQAHLKITPRPSRPLKAT